MDSLIAMALQSVRRQEPLSLELLDRVGEVDPPQAAAALEALALLPEMQATRSSWLPALLLSARPGAGAARFKQLVERMRVECGHRLDPAQMPSLALLLGCSDFLARLLVEHPHWALELAGDPPSPPKQREPQEGSGWTQIREAKYRGLARAAARELIGCPLPESLRELTALAERCVVRALECAAREAGCDVPTVVVLGDLGSREASIAPELDLVLLAPDRCAGRVDGFVSALREGLTERRGVGDLYRLRASDAGRDALCHGIQRVDEAASAWRKAASRADGPDVAGRLRGARHLAGSAALAQRFISETAGLRESGPRAGVRGNGSGAHSYGEEGDLRNGPGGIRLVQRFVQELAETHVSEEAELGHGSAYDALCWLGRRGSLGEFEARVLRDAYGWLRRAEHFLQLADEAPLHHIPKDDVHQGALARRMGYREVDAAVARGRLMRDWQSIRTQVTAICA